VLQWQLGRSNYTEDLTLSPKTCQEMSGGGPYVRGCVRDSKPDAFVFSEHTVSRSRVRALLVCAIVVTILIPIIWSVGLASCFCGLDSGEYEHVSTIV